MCTLSLKSVTLVLIASNIALVSILAVTIGLHRKLHQPAACSKGTDGDGIKKEYSRYCFRAEKEECRTGSLKTVLGGHLSFSASRNASGLLTNGRRISLNPSKTSLASIQFSRWTFRWRRCQYWVYTVLHNYFLCAGEKEECLERGYVSKEDMSRKRVATTQSAVEILTIMSTVWCPR